MDSQSNDICFPEISDTCIRLSHVVTTPSARSSVTHLGPHRNRRSIATVCKVSLWFAPRWRKADVQSHIPVACSSCHVESQALVEPETCAVPTSVSASGLKGASDKSQLLLHRSVVCRTVSQFYEWSGARCRTIRLAGAFFWSSVRSSQVLFMVFRFCKNHWEEVALWVWRSFDWVCSTDPGAAPQPQGSRHATTIQ